MRQPLPPRRSFWKGLVVQASLTAVWAGAAGTLVGGVWLGTKLMVDPDAVAWLSASLPDWTQISLEPQNPPQTLDEIRDRAEADGQLIAEPIEIARVGDREAFGNRNRPDLLIPVLNERPAPCEAQCIEIVALRVYQPLPSEWSSGDRQPFYLAAEVPISGPAESYAIAPLVNARDAAPGSTRPLPLTNLQQLSESAPDAGLWFNLVGERVEGDTRLTYGQLYHYNPERYSWSLMLQWSSPAGQLPRWQSFTGDGSPELVVDRTLGLEPDFAVYRLQSRNFLLNPVQLVAVSLNEPALDSRTYKNALLLARNGLWSDAERILNSIRRESGTKWTPDAQAQLDTIAFHADIVRTQAEAAWASPSQKILAALLDGRWREAQAVLREASDRAPDVVSMLSSDTRRLWRRIDAKLRVNPTAEPAIVWGAIVRSLQDGRAAGLTWLEEQENRSPETAEQVTELLDLLQVY